MNKNFERRIGITERQTQNKVIDVLIFTLDSKFISFSNMIQSVFFAPDIAILKSLKLDT